MLIIRHEMPGDAPEVRSLLIQAFNRPDEADLVEVLRVDLHLPTPDEMPDKMLEIAAAIAWVNYRVEGRGCLWLMVNSCREPKFMYLPDIKLTRTIGERAHPEVDVYDPINELLLLVSPNWEIFPGELIGEDQATFHYRINVKERVGKSCEECWEFGGEKLGEVGREGMVKAVGDE